MKASRDYRRRMVFMPEYPMITMDWYNAPSICGSTGSVRNGNGKLHALCWKNAVAR
jgi:hypothetical protein